jgi:hypothetical protein
MANVNDASRMNCEDAYRADVNGNPVRHRCEAAVSCINDLDAPAAAMAAALQHPQVQAVLNRSFDAGIWPDQVSIPIAELLGPSGHE